MKPAKKQGQPAKDKLVMVRIPESLLRVAKGKAGFSGKTLTEVLTEALRIGLK